MSIHGSARKVLLHGWALLLLSCVLVACGGGGGGGGGDDDDDSGDVLSTAVCPGSGTAIANPVVYLATLDGVRPPELFVADIDDPMAGSFRLNEEILPGQSIDHFALSPDSRCVVYIADQDVNGRFELYSVDIANPGVTARLNPALDSDRDVFWFEFSSDGSQVLYVADQDNDNVDELYMVDIDSPGVATKVNSPLIGGGDVAEVDFAFSPDGSKILYAADQRTVGLFELFLVDKSTPGVSQVVNATFQAFVELRTGSTFSPDNNWIGYIADQDLDEVGELYLVDASTPGVSTKVNPDYAADQDMCSFKFSPDSNRIVYCAEEDSTDSIELYTVALASPGNSQKLNPMLVANGDVEADFQFSTDSTFIVYRADQDVDEQRELYHVEIANPGMAVTLNGALTLNGDVFGFDVRPDDLAVVYDADQETDTVRELYQVEIASPGSSTKLNPTLAGSLITSPVYSADGVRAFYIADQDDADLNQLYRVDVADPVASSLRLNAGLSAGGEVVDFAIP